VEKYIEGYENKQKANVFTNAVENLCIAWCVINITLEAFRVLLDTAGMQNTAVHAVGLP